MRTVSDASGHAVPGLSHASKWLSELFLAPEHPVRGSRWALIAYPLASFMLVAASLLRQSGVSATQSIWAEDGTIFLAQAKIHPFGWTLTHTYNGYVQLWPRLVAEMSLLFPFRDAAAVFALSGACMVAALALLVFRAARTHIRFAPLRALLAGSMVLLPVANAELLNNAVDMGWWLFFAAFWMLLWRPRTLAGGILAGAVCGLATATDPVVGIYLPLAFARLITVRQIRQQLPTVGLCCGLVYQGAVILNAGGQVRTSSASTHGLLGAFGFHVALGWLTGVRVSNYLLDLNRLAALGIGALLFLAVVAIGLLRRAPELRVFTVASLCYSVAAFLIPVWDRGAGAAMDVAPITSGGRYGAVSILLVVGVVLMAADRSRRPAGSRSRYWTRPSAAALLVCLGLLVPWWIIDFQDSNGRTSAEPWASQVARADVHCRAQPTDSVALHNSPAGWTTQLPCRSLLSSSG